MSDQPPDVPRLDGVPADALSADHALTGFEAPPADRPSSASAQAAVPARAPRPVRAAGVETEDRQAARRASTIGRRLAVLGGMRPTLVDAFAGERHMTIALSCVLLATMVEAMTSGGFAVAQAFPATETRAAVPLPVVLTFAVAWGLIIFAIDRYMVLGLEGVHGGRALILMLFRAVLALILGFVMATPLVIAILSSDLQTQIRVIKGEELEQVQRQQADAWAAYLDLKATSDLAQTELAGERAKRTPTPDDDPDVVRTRQTMEASRQACAAAELKAAQEYNGVLPKEQGGSGTKGPGPQWRALDAAAETTCAQATADARAYDSAIVAAGVVPEGLDEAIGARRLAADQALAASDDAYAAYRATADAVEDARNGASSGLLTSMAALSRLIDGHPATAATTTTAARPATPPDRQAWWTHAGLVAVLIALELTPVLFKGTRQALHGWRRGEDYLSPYERACRDEDERAGRRIAEWDDATSAAWRTEAEVVVRSAEDMSARQQSLQQDMNAEVVVTQRVLMRHALRQWRREQAARWGANAAELENEVEALKARDFWARRRPLRPEADAAADAGREPPPTDHTSAADVSFSWSDGGHEQR
jgi:hypothetical protein